MLVVVACLSSAGCLAIFEQSCNIFSTLQKMIVHALYLVHFNVNTLNLKHIRHRMFCINIAFNAHAVSYAFTWDLNCTSILNHIKL